MTERTRRWLDLDTTIPQRVSALLHAYRALFGKEHGGVREEKLVLSCAPGRAELLGCHTDYNEGYTLSATVTQNLLMLGEPRKDGIIHVASFDKEKNVVRFTANSADELLRQKAPPESEGAWANYVKGVLWSFKKKGLPVFGFNAVIQSTIPLVGGVSSSAALELATAQFAALAARKNVPPETLIQICKEAENNYVGIPCGFLDQGTIALADSALLQIDYRPSAGHSFTWKKIPMDIRTLGYSFVVGYDQGSKHTLVDGTYAVRQTACKNSVPVLQELLPDKKINALRDVTQKEFRAVRSQFTKKVGEVVANFVTHVVDENERVLQGTEALQQQDMEKFGNLMIASGKSATTLFGLDEGTPELPFVYDTVLAHQTPWGVVGVRNMGGGFNATTVSLLYTDIVSTYKKALNDSYIHKFGREYTFLDFVPSPSMGILNLSQIQSAVKGNF